MYVPKTISLFEVYIGTQNKEGASVWQNITQTEVRLFSPNVLDILQKRLLQLHNLSAHVYCWHVLRLLQ